MPVTIGWDQIALRLILTVIAGGLIGLNRGEHGRPAGLRTVLLVTLAASISMIQMNLLMPTTGKAHDSFVVIDLMRLPLGILTGVGFIGAGAILRRENIVIGVTTAATLWYVTVMGLCFGGGQIELGTAACLLGLFVLWVLKWVEARMRHYRQAVLNIVSGDNGIAEEELRTAIGSSGFRIASLGVSHDHQQQRREIVCEVHWTARFDETQPPAFLDKLAQLPGVVKLKWSPVGSPSTPG